MSIETQITSIETRMDTLSTAIQTGATTAEVEELTSLTFVLKELKKLNEQADNFPIGTVVAWNDNGGTIPIPDKFVRCDGSLINDSESPLNGLNSPIMNQQTHVLGDDNFQAASFSLNGGSGSLPVVEVIYIMKIK